nr:hypothetical protein [Moraxella sp. CTOTU48841]
MLELIFYLLVAVGFIGLIAIVMFVTVAIPFWRMAYKQQKQMRQRFDQQRQSHGSLTKHKIKLD